jgi:hypothetical protein
MVAVSQAPNLYRAPYRRHWERGAGRGKAKAFRASSSRERPAKPPGGLERFRPAGGSHNPRVVACGERKAKRAATLKAALHLASREGFAMLFKGWPSKRERRYQLLTNPIALGLS